ncbi:MAG TPA: DUF1385 domain-containing protein [Candidatus Limnocylindrales bacterium]
MLKFGARHRANPIVKTLLYPGLLVQKITTKQPTDDMIEVAIVSMEQALEADGEAVPAGSGEFPRRPMELAPVAGDTAASVVQAERPAQPPAAPPPLPTDPPPSS